MRKFIMVFCIFFSVAFFASGVAIMSYVNQTNSTGAFNGMLDEYKVPDSPINVLIMVGDATSGNTDTMMVVNYNPATAEMNMLSIPRDTKVNIKSSIPKINSAYIVGGAEYAVNTVKNLLNINIDYYAYVNIKTFRQIIDLLGGVRYNVPIDMDYEDPTQNLYIHLKKGEQVLDGEKAEQFLRFRHPNGKYSKEMLKYYDGSDIKRIEAQQNFLKEMIRQKANIFSLTKINEIITTVLSNLETNIKLDDALKLAKNIVKLDSKNVRTFNIPGDYVTYTYSYFIPDSEKTNEIVKQYFQSKGVKFDYSSVFEKVQSTNNITSRPKATKKQTTNTSVKQSIKPSNTIKATIKATETPKPTKTHAATTAAHPTNTPSKTVVTTPAVTKTTEKATVSPN